jgi:Dyp-type peroxidase family
VATADNQPDWSNIQGNIAGFNKDHQAFLLFRFGEPDRARAWIGEVAKETASVDEVRRFNELFKLIRRRQGREGVVEASWMNVAFTCPGLEKLGAEGIDGFPRAFRAGMRVRATEIGDVGDSGLNHWVAGLGAASIDVLILLASDSRDDLHEEIEHHTTLSARFGLRMVFLQEGATRRDAPGHEHFGFKDGISQPAIEGLAEPGTEDTLPLGEFVVGHKGLPAPQPGEPGYPRRDDGQELPGWATDGSFLVFRRLRQDVPGFRGFVSQSAADIAPGAEDRFGAKLVGRYSSGVPLALADNAPVDPGSDSPLAQPDRINEFEYDDDPDGENVPRAAHIRKTYPRKQVPPGAIEGDRHRILRRGIPFGYSFRNVGHRHPAYGPGPGFPNDRGLIFLCYQASIERQFEFIQRRWANRDDFPEPGDGQDPIIAQESPWRSFRIAGHDPITGIAQWVTTTGGEYFFSPSIRALCDLAEGTTAPPSAKPTPDGVAF